MPFLTDITLGQYVATESAIHRLDPRTKLFSAIMLMIVIMMVQQMVAYFIIAIFLGWIIVVSALSPLMILRNIRPFLWLFGLTILLHSLMGYGGDGWQLPGLGLSLSRDGLVTGLMYALRLALFIVVAALLTMTTAPIDMADALEAMLSPLKRFRVPVHELVMMMTLAIRFIPTLMEEADKLRKAQISRGVSFHGPLFRRIRQIVPLLIPLFISVFRRADELAVAMDARCYTGGDGRTSYKTLNMCRFDYFAIAFVIASSLALMIAF